MALITDGRFSGATHGLMAGHVAPEAAAGGPIAAVRDGDIISFDLPARTLSVDARCDGDGGAAGAVARARRRAITTGVMAKYARLVSSAVGGSDDGVLTSGSRVLWFSGSRVGF